MITKVNKTCSRRQPGEFFLIYLFGIIFVLLLVTSLDLHAQGKIWFDKIGVEDGLANSTIYAMMQDDEGYIWIGTRNGLNCYDGYTFRSFDANFIDSTTISYSWVNCLYQDHDGYIWLGTEGGGLNRIDKKTGIVDKYMSQPGLKNSLLDSYIYGITEDEDNNLWIATLSGISVLDEQRKNYRNFSFDPNKPGSLADYSVYDILIDEKKSIWIASYGGGLNLYDPASGLFKSFRHKAGDKSSISSDSLWQIRQDKKDNNILWISTTDGLNRFDKTSGVFTTYRMGKTRAENKIQPLLVDDQGRIWLGTDEKGLYCFNPSTLEISHYENDPSESGSLSGNSLLSIYQDKSGLIWVCSRYSGINLVHETNFRNLISETPAIQGNSVYSINEQGKFLWIGTNKGMYKYDRSTKNVVHHPIPRGKFSDKERMVYAALIDKNGNLWVGTKAAGLYMLPKNGNSFKGFFHDVKDSLSISGDEIYCIREDKKGIIWIGTYRSGLNSYDYRTGKFTRYKLDTDSLNTISGNEIIDVLPDEKGGLWIATSGEGLSRLDLATGKLKCFRTKPSDNTSLDDGYLKYLYLYNDSTLCIGTYSGGLNVLDIPTGSFSHYSRKEGLPSNMVVSICEDARGDLWLSTDNGLCIFNMNTLKTRDFGPRNGLSEIDFNTGATHMDSEGNLYFGGATGLIYFDPDKLAESNYKPVVTIVDFRLEYQPKNVDIQDIKRTVFFNQDSIFLDYHQSSFRFFFSSMLFSSPGRNQYKFMLEGFEKKWSSPQSINYAQYSNLPPGKYVFRVKGSNNDGVWNDTDTKIYIHITPPFWETLLFRILVFFSGIILIYLFVVIRERTLRRNQEILARKVRENTIEIRKQSDEIIAQRDLAIKQKALIELQNTELEKHRTGLELLVRERTAELELARIKAEESDRLKSAFIANMSHEIRTPLNAIIGFSDVLNNDDHTPEERAEYIKIIRNNGNSLIRLINDILDVSILDAGRLELKMQKCSITEILSDIHGVFQNRLQIHENKDIVLVNELGKTKEIILHTDPVRFSQIIGNLIDNAIKFTEKGTIRFGCNVIDYDGEKIARFHVSDTGIGLSNEQIDKLFMRFSRVSDTMTKLYRGTGLGLSICKSLVELMGGKIWVESTINVGSTFYFTLPFSHIHEGVKEKAISCEITKTLMDTVVTILIVEDEDNSYLLLKVMLSKSGYVLLRAKNGEEAVEIVKSRKVDLVMMDIHLPKMNGYEATAQIKAYNNNIVVIAQTAYAFEPERQKMMEAGCNEILTKPLTQSRVLEVIEKYLKTQ
ncbi:MAG: two-component regulator propeller domain-containing protein [Bacteroidales bacterium]